jgi:hypothetical protein
MKLVLAGLALGALMVAGCTKIPFTHDMREEYELTPYKLTRVQFYTSGDILLERRVERTTGEPTDTRRLQLTQAEVIRKISIPEGTPGVVVGVEDDRLEVSFEEGKSLFFGSKPETRAKLGGLYSLMAARWNGGYGELEYGGERFRARPTSGSVHLMVDVEDIKKTKVVSKTVKGRTATNGIDGVLSGLTVESAGTTPAPVAPEATRPTDIR